MASDHNRGHQGRPSTNAERTYQGQDKLAQQLSELARSLQQQDSVQDTLMNIVRAAVDNVPGAQFAGISVVEARHKVITGPASPTGSWCLSTRTARPDRPAAEIKKTPCIPAAVMQLDEDPAQRQSWVFGVDEVVVFSFDDPVAVTGGAFEPRPITNGDHPAGIADELLGVESTGDLRDCRAAYSEHLGEEFLGQGELVTAHAVVGGQ